MIFVTVTMSITTMPPSDTVRSAPTSERDVPATIDAGVRTALATAPTGELVSVLVTLDRQRDVMSIDAASESTRRARVLAALRETARNEQRDLLRLIAKRAAESKVVDVTPLWVVNAIALRATPGVIGEIAVRPEVRSVGLDRVEAIVPARTGVSGSPTEPNLSVVGAPALWGLGARGGGVVVATIDTGVDGTHPDLAERWRGGSNSWFDPNDEHPDDPIDINGHGTSVMGVLAGGAAGGTAVGMAPAAQWIAVKVFDDRGEARTVAIHEAFQWTLDPDGNPATDDAPDVVNASWSFGAPGCNREFEPDVRAVRAAGILPVFAAGNIGPAAGTAVSPASYADAFAVGATDDADALWPQSGRGPDACTAWTHYPDLAAPGVGIHTTDTSGLYTNATGTSVAAPHVAGALALLVAEFGALTPAEQEAALTAGAIDLGAAGVDNNFGHGRLDVARAYISLAAGSITGTAFDDGDGDAVRDEGEPALARTWFVLTSAGPDGALGTGDDVERGRRNTDSRGEYAFEGLAAGVYQVRVDPASTPPGRVHATGNVPINVVLASGTDRRGVDAAYTAPASITGTVFNDIDRDRTRESGEAGMAQIGVTLHRPGADGVYATSDDAAPVSVMTNPSGGYQFPTLSPGPYRIDVNAVTVPSGMTLTTSNVPLNGVLAAGANVQTAPIGYALPLHLLSLLDDGTVGGVSYRDEDVLAYSGTAFSMLLDGSDVGLGGADIDAIDRLADGSYVLSVDGSVSLAGVGAITDEDLVRFLPTQLGPTTQGAWTMYFDGSDVGLAGVDVDAFDLIGPWLFLSVDVDTTLPGLGGIADEDLVRFNPSALGATTQGSWHVYFDGSDVGLTQADEDIDGFQRDPAGRLHVSTVGNHSVGSSPVRSGGDDDVLVCIPTSLGTTTSCAWQAHSFSGISAGLAVAADVDAVTQQ